MKSSSFLRSPGRLLFTVALLLIGTMACYGEDTYNGAQLTIPTVTIGSATFTNVVVTPLKIVSVSGGTANGTVDSYNPVNNELTIPIVFFAGTTYTNVVITVRSLVSVGSVTGVLDFLNGPELSIPSVQVLGGAVYHDVLITVGGIVRHDGGMPASVGDVYAPATKELTIAVIEYGGKIYTNTVITVGSLLSVGPSSLKN
jgi:hypothetical protein